MLKKTPVDEEITFDADQVIVSKTDLKGRILYVNSIFCQVSEMTTAQLIGEPHSIIRHPDMPRTIFKLMWDMLKAKDEVFAYVKNMSASGRYYWVLAHVTPTFDASGQVIGYHSNRRVPPAKGRVEAERFYSDLKAAEDAHVNRKEGLAAGYQLLEDTLSEAGQPYDAYVWSMGGANA